MKIASSHFVKCADYCSVFDFQIKEWFQFNMLQALLLIINNRVDIVQLKQLK